MPDDFSLVVDLIAQEEATVWIEKLKAHPNAALAHSGVVWCIVDNIVMSQ